MCSGLHGLPMTIDPVLLQRLRQDLASGLGDYLDDDVSVQRATALQLVEDISKHGAIVQYRDQMREQALDAIISFTDTSITDVAALAGLQKSISAYISVEIFISEHIGELNRLTRGDVTGVGEVGDAEVAAEGDDR